MAKKLAPVMKQPTLTDAERIEGMVNNHGLHIVLEYVASALNSAVETLTAEKAERLFDSDYSQLQHRARSVIAAYRDHAKVLELAGQGQLGPVKTRAASVVKAKKMLDLRVKQLATCFGDNEPSLISGTTENWEDGTLGQSLEHAVAAHPDSVDIHKALGLVQYPVRVDESVAMEIATNSRAHGMSVVAYVRHCFLWGFQMVKFMPIKSADENED